MVLTNLQIIIILLTSVLLLASSKFTKNIPISCQYKCTDASQHCLFSSSLLRRMVKSLDEGCAVLKLLAPHSESCVTLRITGIQFIIAGYMH